MPRASILGTGLIGTSVGLGLSSAGWQVAGWDPDADALAMAASRGAVRPTSDQQALLVEPGDLLVLAGPPRAALATLRELETDALVTDVGGVKEPVVAAARHLPHFVGGHPMAGREVTGPQAASAGLFRGAAWVVLTDTGAAADISRVEAVVAQLGANPVRMTAAEHDAAVAVISHLPQVVAAALVGEAQAAPGALRLAAGSFRDLTRVAASDPGVWIELLLANAGEVGPGLRRFASRLAAWADAVEGGDETELGGALAAARSGRAELGPVAVAVRVALADRPGELARVGHALEASSVDVRDLQLRHAPHGGGGILSLFVRPAEAALLRQALADEGLLLDD